MFFDKALIYNHISFAIITRNNGFKHTIRKQSIVLMGQACSANPSDWGFEVPDVGDIKSYSIKWKFIFV